MRWLRRGSYLVLAVALLTVLGACGSGSGQLNVITDRSEGTLRGFVYDADGDPLSGVPVSITPPSLSGPGGTQTGPDGGWQLRAPAGAVAVTANGAGAVSLSRPVTVTANVTTTVATLLLQPSLGATTAGNLPPQISAAAAPANVGLGAVIPVTATVTDGDTAATDLRVVALASTADGLPQSVGVMALGPDGYAVDLPLPGDLPATTTLQVRVVAVDSPGSNQSTERVAGDVVYAAD
ncbi:MAG: carboxypeptidase regulatory-like domain-containing protein [Fimbriimonadaceae bacterium]|nr:carboxypeptidase regulatory-like domain-containing protein [Fimbriimonadaceae bacterium]